jgi:hypothetical protein
MTPVFVSEGLVAKHRSVALCEPQADCLPYSVYQGEAFACVYVSREFTDDA